MGARRDSQSLSDNRNADRATSCTGHRLFLSPACDPSTTATTRHTASDLIDTCDARGRCAPHRPRHSRGCRASGRPIRLHQARSAEPIPGLLLEVVGADGENLVVVVWFGSIALHGTAGKLGRLEACRSSVAVVRSVIELGERIVDECLSASLSRRDCIDSIAMLRSAAR